MENLKKKGFVTVKDYKGNTFQVHKTDIRYINGELIHMSTKDIDVIYNNSIFSCPPNHPHVFSGKYKKIKSSKKKYFNKNTGEVLYLYDEDPLTQKDYIVNSLKYRITVRNKDGECFSVYKNDYRLKTGEVIPATVKHTIYCNFHGLQKIENQKRLRQSPIPEKYKTYCPKCHEFYLSNEYMPSKKDILDCYNFLNNFYFSNSKQYTEKYFKKYVPRFYKIIKEYNIENLDLKFSEKIWFFKNNIKKIPECKVKKCNNKVELLKSTSHFGFTNYCKKHKFYNFSSELEKEIYHFLKEKYNGNIFQNYRNFENKELDIYIPEKNLGIEVNGLYWHGDRVSNDKYIHYNKYKFFKEKDVELITIWEDDWNFKKDITKSILLNKINLIRKKINARDCYIKEINYKDSKNFLEENHLQGNSNASIRLGLFYNNEIVSLMTFGKRRKILGQRSKEENYELLRFCNKKFTTVRGGASKLFNYFIKKYKPLNIISYANLDISNGNLYKQLGFEDKGHTGINYWWANGKKYHRSNFMKHQLVKEGFDKNKTEDQIMRERGFWKIYGTGNIKWELNFYTNI